MEEISPKFHPYIHGEKYYEQSSSVAVPLVTEIISVGRLGFSFFVCLSLNRGALSFLIYKKKIFSEVLQSKKILKLQKKESLDEANILHAVHFFLIPRNMTVHGRIIFLQKGV